MPFLVYKTKTVKVIKTNKKAAEDQHLEVKQKKRFWYTVRWFEGSQHFYFVSNKKAPQPDETTTRCAILDQFPKF